MASEEHVPEQNQWNQDKKEQFHPEPLQKTISEKSSQFLYKMISGGEAGADIAGLRAARCLNLKTGGTAAPNYYTACGYQSKLLKSFGLSSIPLQSSWAATFSKLSMLNVDNSDATVAFRVKNSPGTDKTIGYCVSRQWKVIPGIPIGTVWERNGYRPIIVITEFTTEAQLALVKFLVDRKIRILNVAGHRPWKENPSWETVLYFNK